MCFVPLSEWGSIDLNYCGSGKGIGTDEFVVGRVEGDDDDTDFASNSLRSPREIASFESKCTIFCVAASSADKMDALISDSSICGLATLFERSATMPSDRTDPVG